MRLPLLFALACAAVPLACTTFRNGPSDAGAGDADNSDVAADGDDAGDDAADAAPKPHFCSTLSPAANFCADFDVGDLEKGFLNDMANPDPGTAGGGKIFPDDDLATSYDQTRSIAFSAPALIATTNKAQSYLIKTVPIAPQDLIIIADIRISTEQIPSTGNPLNDGNLFLFDVMWGTPQTPASAGELSIVREPLQKTIVAAFDGINGLPLVDFTQPLADGVWKELKLIFYNRPVDGGPEGVLNIYLDGVRAAQQPLPASYQGTYALLGLGVPIARGPMGVFQMSMDNLRIYWD